MSFCKVIALFFFVIILFFSCESQVEFLQDDEGKNNECLEKKVEGQSICVEQRVEIFQVGNLSSKSVDFLFILDVSPSMTDDLARLGQAFEALMSQILVSNWRMFFTTADHGDHNYEEDPSSGEKIFSHQKWENYQGNEPYFGQFMQLEYQGKKLSQKSLDAKTSDYVNIFKDTLTRELDEDCSLAPYCQGSLEQPLRVLNSSLARSAQTSTMLSALGESAVFISFIIIDEDERVEDQENATTADEVWKNFNRLFPGKSFHAFSLLIQDEQCLALQKQHSPQSVYGKKVSELAKLTNGKNISLCEEDYGPPLQELSSLLRALIESLD